MRRDAEDHLAVAGAMATMLAVLTLSPLVSGRTWLVVAAVSVLCVMVTGILGRHVLRRWPLVIAAQAIVLVAAMAVLFSRSRLPDPVASGKALIDLLDAGLQLTREQAAPVDASQGVMLLLAGGTGLVALLVDLLAASLRRPALAGLPLLAVYCVPSALLVGGLPWYYFVFAAVGYLVLLATDAQDRVRAWGRILGGPSRGGSARAGSAHAQSGRTASGRTESGRGGPGPGVGGWWLLGPADRMAPGGRRVAVAAVTVAVVLPAVIPGLSDPVLDGLRNSDDGAGRTIRRINPILDLRDDLVSTSRAPLITYTTSVRQPEPLRIVTADVFTGQVWAPGARSVDSDNRATQLMPSPPGLSGAVKTRSAQTRIRIGPLRESYLPLPYPTSQVEAPGRWLYDPITLNVIGDGITTENLSYAVQHVEVTPTAEQLNEAGPAPAATSDYLLLPDGLPPSIRETAVEVAGIGNDYQQAIRLQRWFREDGEFSYSTDAPRARSSASGAEAMAAFLKERRGYCVHFASTMAVMARMLGIPARVGVGFLPGEVQSNGSRVITGQDAHAWPELFFAGVGWVRFEPTPRGGDALPPDWAVPPAGVMPEDGPTSTAETETRSASPSAAATPNRPADESASDPATGAGSGTGVPWRMVLPALLLLVLLATPALGAGVRTRRRWHRARDDPARAEAGWQELREGLGRLGVVWARSWTPRAVRHRLAADYRLPEPAVAALGRLVEDVELACYAPPGAGVGRAVDARRADVRAVVSAVAATRAPAVRRRARWFPVRRVEEPIVERAPVRRSGERISRR